MMRTESGPIPKTTCTVEHKTAPRILEFTKGGGEYVVQSGLKKRHFPRTVNYARNMDHLGADVINKAILSYDELPNRWIAKLRYLFGLDLRSVLMTVLPLGLLERKPPRSVRNLFQCIE